MTAGRYVRRQVDVDVVSAGKKCRNHCCGAIERLCTKHLSRCRPEDIYEGDVYLPAEQIRNPPRQVADHRDTCGFACAVGDQ